MKYIYKFKVRFDDTDAYGIVHHSRYYNYFEEARFQFSADHLGFTEDMANGSNIKFPIIESHCVYKNPLKFSLDYYIIELEFKLLENSKLEFDFIIKDNKNQKKRYAYGKTIHVLIDEQNKLRLDLPQWFIDKIKPYHQNIPN